MLAAAPLWQRLLILTPVFVVGAGIIAGTLILLGRALAQSIRESEHQRLIYAGFVLLLVAVGVLTYLGVQLPSE